MAPTPDMELQHDAARRRGLGALVVAWGIQAIVTQSLLLREALVLMSGSEFAWGVVLFAWLLGVAVGGTAGGWVSSRLRNPAVALVVVLMGLSVAACAELWVFRCARGWLGVGPGELLPLSKTALAAILFIPPTSALVGLAFPLACCISDAGGAAGPKGAGPLGRVYALESAGSLIGGAAFSFWAVEHLAPIQTTLLCVVITAAASARFLLWDARRIAAGASLAAVALVALLLSALGGEALDRALVLRRWSDVAPGYELCAHAESKYQNLAVGRRAEQFTLYCDGQVSTDFPDPYTFVPLAHFWMCQHPAPGRVLLLGGGAEGMLAEILRHPVEQVDYVEPDPRQIELIEPFLAEVDRRALHDRRVTVHHVDARYFVKTQRDRFDLVIARLPEPMSALRARLYTSEFFGELRRAMTARSVLCLTAAATPTNLSAAAGEYLASIRATLERHFAEVIIGWGDPAQVLAGTEGGLISADPARLAERYAGRGVQADLFDPLWFEGATDWLEADKLRQRADELDHAVAVRVSTDLRPVIYLQRLALWERMTSGAGSSGGLIGRLRNVGWGELIVVLFAIGAATMFVHYWRARTGRKPAPPDPIPWTWSGAVMWSVATTGFATMALSIVWLFAFQNLYGYVYQRIGWIIAVFMAGLVLGCWWVDRRSRRRGAGWGLTSYLWRRLVGVDLLLVALALVIPVMLPALASMQDSRLAFVLVEWTVTVMVALTGVLGGAAFALAGGLQLASSGQPGAAAGTVVGADHAGACLGALLTGLLLVPVFGTAACALLLAGIKLTSVALLLLGRRAVGPPATLQGTDGLAPPLTDESAAT